MSRCVWFHLAIPWGQLDPLENQLKKVNFPQENPKWVTISLRNLWFFGRAPKHKTGLVTARDWWSWRVGGNPCLEWNFRRFPDLFKLSVAGNPWKLTWHLENPHVTRGNTSNSFMVDFPAIVMLVNFRGWKMLPSVALQDTGLVAQW